MSNEENKTVIRRFVDEVLNSTSPAPIDGYFTDDFVNHTPLFGVTEGGLDGARKFLAGVRHTFPDGRWNTEDLIAEEDKVVWRWKATGTHKGQFMGIGPTGRRVTWSGITIYRLVGGKIAERWAETDNLGLQQQLSAVVTAL